MKQTPWVYGIFLERYRSWLYVCNMPFHMSEQLNKIGNHIVGWYVIGCTAKCRTMEVSLIGPDSQNVQKTTVIQKQ